MPRAIDIEGCTGCGHHTPAHIRCLCCQQAVCRDCAHIEAGAVWCAACADDAWDFTHPPVLPTESRAEEEALPW